MTTITDSVGLQPGVPLADDPTGRQPRGLWLLFLVEMWERFSYYGMRALLVLYLVSELQWSRADASNLQGTYTSLVYLTPLIGGWLADRFIGTSRSLVIGGVVIALGHFSLAIPGMTFFYLGLALIIIGTGFFKPNVSTMVGQLYHENDPRRDAGFTIFYMGINLGAFLAPLVCGYLGERIGWHYGFGAAGVGMILGLLLYLWGKERYLPGIGLAPREIISETTEKHPLTSEEWHRIAVIFITAFFVIFFWAAFEQAPASLNIFALEYTDRTIGNWEIPATWFQSINPLAILIFAPLFAGLWIRLGKRRIEPPTPAKMALGLIMLGLGFIPLMIAGARADANQLASPVWLLLAYTLHTWGELMLSPVGLSLVTKLAPIQFGSLLMGVWFLANAAANKVAGWLGALMPVAEGAAPAAGAYDSWQNFFMLFVISSVAAGGILLLLSPMLKRMMHGRG